MLQDLQEIKELGRGNGGVVKMVLHKPTNRLMAVKVTNEKKEKKRRQDKTRQGGKWKKREREKKKKKSFE